MDIVKWFCERCSFAFKQLGRPAEGKELKCPRCKQGDSVKKEEVKKAEDQPQDLGHHKTEETDTLVKAENPSDDFMDYNDLDKETHGKK